MVRDHKVGWAGGLSAGSAFLWVLCRPRFMLWIATPVSLALWMLPWMSR